MKVWLFPIACQISSTGSTTGPVFTVHCLLNLSEEFKGNFSLCFCLHTLHLPYRYNCKTCIFRFLNYLSPTVVSCLLFYRKVKKEEKEKKES